MIEGCIKNDRKHQEMMYKFHFDKMYQMCLRYSKDEAVICGIINDSFLLVFKNIHKFECRGSLEGWIRRITFNTMADYFRKENKQLKFLLLEEAANNSFVNEGNKDDYDDIILKVNTLSGSFKEVFIKYAIEGYNHREIGEALRISEGTSKWYLAEARKKLQLLFNFSTDSYQYGK